MSHARSDAPAARRTAARRAPALLPAALLPAALLPAALLPAALLPGALLLARAAAAQTTDAAIVGTVRDSAGRPLGGVEVTARDAATGFRTATTTNAAGQFSLLQLPLGGPYAVALRRLGYRPETRTGYALTLGARVRVDAALAPVYARGVAARLAPVEVAAGRDADRRPTVGENFRVGARAIAAVPAVNRSFTDLASLAPTAGPQNGLLGQRWTSTDVRIDGAQARNLFRAGEAGAGPYTISLEAVREFLVTTTDYDVAQGRQGGGAIRAATKAGTNTVEGAVFAYRRGSDLSAPTDYQGRGRDLRQFTTTQWGGAVGGPVVRDRLHYFAALDRQDGSTPLVSGVLNTSADQVAAGVARDSVTRLLQILQSAYGLNPARPQLGRLARRPGATTGFGRLDWELSDRHHLTLRSNLNWWSNPLSGGVDQALALAEARSDFRSREQQHVAALRSTADRALGGPLENDLTLGLNVARRTLTPVSGELPRGFVRIQSTLPDGTKGDTRVQFGGNRLAPDSSREREWQLIDVVHAQRGPVLVTVGTDNTLTRTETFIGESQSGLFEFQSLADLAARKPFRYSRTVPLGGTLGGAAAGPRTAQSVLELGAFAQAEWRPAGPRWGALADRLVVTGGLRWDGTGFLTRPAYDRVVDSLFHVRTDRRPSDVAKVEPRGQVVWDVSGGAGAHPGRDVVRVGAGRFVPQLPYYLEHNQLQNTGLTLADVTLTGAAVPAPDYAAYRANPAAIPGVPAGAAPPPSYVNVVDPNFRSPSVWKASAAYQRRVAGWLTLTGSVLGTRTTGNYTYYDLNLRPAPAFALDDEGGRGVFVPASTITAAGVTQNSNAWVTKAVGRTLELRADGRARQVAGVAEASVRLPKGAQFDLSYTRNRTRDNSSYGCCLARTMTTYTPVASDPRDLSGAWGPSDVDFKHKVVVAGELPAVLGFRVSGRYVGSTGRPFSAVVNGDVNGDEANGNDLAFVFNPDDPRTPADVAAGMRRVLANPANVARDYLRANLGRVATRNGATVPWTGRLDVRLARDFPTARGPRGQRVQLTADVFNFANLLNRTWGAQELLPAGISDQNPVTQRVPLLNVVGFDQATRRSRYTVNESFGVLSRGGDPYQIQLGARYAF